MKKLYWIVPLALLLLIQLYPSKKPVNKEDLKSDIIKSALVPDSIAGMLRSACYDCHSFETEYPWYASVAPVSWLVNRDVKVGREKVNLTLWDSLTNMQKARILTDIVDEVEEGEMPMSVYTLMHPKARLSAAERETLVKWAEDLGESLFE